MNTIGDQQLVKRLNRSALLRLLRAQPGLSRARLACESGLTKSTVSLLVRELLEDGWLAEAGAPVAGGPGRPSTPLQISVQARALIGVDIAVECVRVVCVSLLGEVLHTDEKPLRNLQPRHVCTQTARLVAQASRVIAARGLQLAGVGVGLPGAFDDATGMVRFAPNLGWRNIGVLPMLERALAAADVQRVALYMQNDADVAALGEYEFGGGEGEGPLIYVSCDVGVGAGIVLNDRLFTGSQGLAGEIGHSILAVDGPPCSCGRHGCAEAFVGARAVAGRGGVQRGGRMLGVLLQNLWTMFNPRTIVVGGKSCITTPTLLQVALETLERYAQVAGMPAPSVRPARHGLLATAVGAAALVLHQDLRPLQRRATAVRTGAHERSRTSA
ncbi:MAG TPA: ROK family transcriptional regulator [Burkholderiaceae bacterium]